MSTLERELSQLEANLGSVERLQCLAGLLGVLNAALLEGNHRFSRIALIRLRARLEGLAAGIYRIQGAVERQIETIRGELTDAD